MADADVQGMLIRIEATTAQLRRELATADSAVAGTSKKIDKSLSGVDGAFDRAGKSAQSAANLIKSALAIAAGAGLVGSFIKQADAYGQMASRLKMVTGSTAEYNAVQKQLMEISDRTYKPLEEQQELFIRSSKSMKELGYSTKDTIDFIDSASSALTINAATSEKGSQAIDALSKAMITGKLGGDEWNAVLEIIPTTVGDLAKSMGKSETAVKQMAVEGKLQTKVYVDALIAAQKQNAKLAEDMPTTVGDSLTKLSNHFSAVVGEINEATGATGVFSGVIDDLSALLADGEVTAGAIEGFTNWMTAIKTVTGEISSLADQIDDFVGDATASSFSIGEAFSQMPINLRAAVQIAVVEVAHFIDNVLNQAQAATAYLKALPQGLEAASAAYDSTRAQMAANDQARSDTIDGIFAERDALLTAGKAAGDAYREQHKALGTISTERTAAVKTLTDEEKKAQKAAADAAAALAKSQAKALADLKAQSDIAIASATGLAAAYLAGTDKSRDFALQQKVEEALLKTGAAARDEVTDKLKKQRAAEELLAVSKQAYDLQQETTDLIAQAKATLMGADALEDYNVQKAMQVALAGKNIEVGSKEYQQLLDATKAQQDAVKVAKQAGDAGSIMDRLYPQSKLLKDYTEDQKSLNAAMALYPEHAAEYQAALQRLGVEYEQNKNAATEWGKFTEGAVDRIDEAFANMWESVLSKSGDFMDTLKNSFRQFLAEMLHMAITKPIIVQIGSALGVGGLAASDSGGGLLSGLTGGGSITSLLSNASSVVSVAGSKFGQAIMSGWSGGDGIIGGLEGALGNGADYIGSVITGAFTSGSASAATAAANLASSTSAATVDLINNTVSIGGQTVGTASGLTTTAASSSLASLSSTLSYIGAAYSVISSFSDYGVKGGATTAGFAAGGAYIGSLVGPIGTAAGAAIGSVLGSFVSGKLFGGSGEKYADLSTSAQGTYSGGQYSSIGTVQGWQTNAPKYGSSVDAQLDSTVNQFASTLGKLYDVLGNGSDVYAYDMMQVRKTSGKYSTSFGATLDNGTGVGLDLKQQFSAEDAAAALATNYDDIMGTFLAKAIVSSVSLPDYFKAQFTDFADSWDTTADEVIQAIEGVFTRFNGVNDALSLINVNNLKLDNTGLMASDSILNMVAAMSNLDTATATAKDKVDALNTVVGTFYSAFHTADEQFADLTKSLQGAFAGFGLDLPDTRSAYRDMVEDIDVTTAAGQSMFATMMGLAGNADSYYSTLEQKATTAQQAAADAAQTFIDGLMGNASTAFSALQRSITAAQKQSAEAYSALTTSLNDALSTANTNVSNLTGVNNDLSSALKALRGDSDDAVQMLRAQAQATLQSALATAKAGGSLANFTGLSDALDTVSDNNTDLYSSLEDFNRDQGRTANVVAELNALNGKQLTNAEKSVKALQDQLDQAKKAYDAQTAQFDAQLAFAQSQLDALNGVDNSVMGVTDAVNAMNAAVVAALGTLKSATPGNTGTLIDSVYQSVLGQNADTAGKTYWQGQVSNGSLGYDQLAEAITNAAAENAIKSAYTSVLGRDADAAGAKYWTDQVASGALTVAQLQEAIKNAAIANGSVGGYATGGLISGPGTGTSDSILARLSNGEFVMNADAVRMFGPDLLSQMNGLQIPAFAAGGPVLDIAAPSQVFSASRSQSSSGADGSGQLEQKVDVLIDVVKQIIGPMKVDSAKNQKLFSKWDKDGLPATTTASASA